MAASEILRNEEVRGVYRAIRNIVNILAALMQRESISLGSQDATSGPLDTAGVSAMSTVIKLGHSTISRLSVPQLKNDPHFFLCSIACPLQDIILGSLQDIILGSELLSIGRSYDAPILPRTFF